MGTETETHPVRWINTVNLDLAHSVDDGLCAVDDVLVYGRTIGQEFVAGEALLVNDFHLFDDG